MPYTIPEMPLTCDIYEMVDDDFNNKVLSSTQYCNLLPPKRGAYNPYTWDDDDTIGAFPLTLLLPKLSDVCASVQRTSGYGDLIHITELPLFWFYVNTVYPVAFGYPNQYLVALITPVGRHLLTNAPPAPGRYL